ncbi:MAG: OmpA family protein, partial [Bacteroidales bacterium]
VSGKYAIATEINKEEPKNLIINVKKEGHSYDTKLITKDQLAEQVITKDAEVKKVEVGKTYDLHDIYFETNEYTLSNDSKYIIDLFVEFLHDNPTIKVEIQGHTDNVGDDKANLILSENRAMAVYDYAVSRKVDETRLRYKGYGESSPIAPNDTPSGRAKNRRTIFLIYEK